MRLTARDTQTLKKKLHTQQQQLCIYLIQYVQKIESNDEYFYLSHTEQALRLSLNLTAHFNVKRFMSCIPFSIYVFFFLLLCIFLCFRLCWSFGHQFFYFILLCVACRQSHTNATIDSSFLHGMPKLSAWMNLVASE